MQKSALGFQISKQDIFICLSDFKVKLADSLIDN